MNTIRRQLTRKLLLGFALLLGGGFAAIYFSTREALVEQFDEILRAKASAISSATEQHGNRVVVKLPEHFMLELEEDAPADFFQLRRPDGTTVKRSKSLANADLPADLGRSEHARFGDVALPSGHRGRAVGYLFDARHSREEEEVEGAALSLVVASDRRELDETLWVLALALLGCGALMLVSVVLIVPRVLKRELTPLDHLAEQTARITADSLSTRFPTDNVPGELRPISDRLNNLLSRLEQSFERERRFSADLAHELRTPIAELRSLADLALKWPESRSTEADRDTLAIAVQMEGIVVRLLELLRSEHGQLRSTRESVFPAQLLQEVWQPFVEKAAEKKLKIEQAIPADLRLESDPVLLRSILANLVDNAVEYTPVGGGICVEAETGEGRFTLRVANSVEHLEPADLPKFFDRFWRKDPARSSAKHCGLGLSLAHAFAQSLGCELTATLDKESRVVLTLAGPVAVVTK